MFSIAQFASELEIFHDLPSQIGPAGNPGARPLNAAYYRNVTGICDDPTLIQRYNEIADTIKTNSNMHGILINIQLDPRGVICLAYPLVNSEDFQNGIVLNSTGVIGLDLINNPVYRYIAERTIESNNVVVQGPITLRQCADMKCDPTVSMAFVARISIASKVDVIEVNGIPYNKWGFAAVLINWNALIEQSNIYESFAEKGYGFQLTRTDIEFNANGTMQTEKVRSLIWQEEEL